MDYKTCSVAKMDLILYKNKLVAMDVIDGTDVLAYGVVIDANDEWTLFKWNPCGFILDGYKIIKNSDIKKVWRTAREEFYQKVMETNGLDLSKEDVIKLSTLSNMIKMTSKKYNVFALCSSDSEFRYVGILKNINNKKAINLDHLNPGAIWDGEMLFSPEEITKIVFDSNYINSLYKFAPKEVFN